MISSMQLETWPIGVAFPAIRCEWLGCILEILEL